MSSWSSTPVLYSIGIALLCGTAVPAGAEVRRAVIVGIDKYAPPAGARAAATPPAAGRATRSGWSDLDGAVNDAEAIRQVLISRFGFRESDVHVLTNAQATRDGIVGAVRTWLIDAAAPGDVSVFFYAGHGSRVKNSMSAEADKMDESLVPADANAGRPDLRDKEIARLFNDALDKKVVLTALIDSCHSGSVARGVGRVTKLRVLPPDERDVADSSAPVPPETRGALILSAAQDFQYAAETADDDRTSHGLFTWALLKTLRSMPVNQSADRMFLQLRAIMQAGETIQEPVMAGTPERRRAALFGVDRPAATGATVVAVQAVQADGSVLLQGGVALGLRKGSELRRVGGRGAAGAVTLQVSKEQGLTRSVAVAVGGTTTGLTAGTLFEVTKWSAPAGPGLRVWLGFPGGTADDLVRQAQRFASTAAGLVLVNDPTASEGPNNTIQWTGKGWELAVPGSPALPLPAGAPAVPKDAPLVRDTTGAARVTLNVPLPAGITLDPGDGGDSIQVLATPEHADYVLAGRQRGNTLEYAWIRPLATTGDDRASTLPVRTDWIPLGSDPRALVTSLQQFATRLAAIRTWLQLESPPDAGRFPYYLALKNSATGQLHSEGTVKEGERYGLVLALDEALARGAVVPRYVYVFALDGMGKTTLLFPSLSGGTVENRHPANLAEGAGPPKQIALGPSELFGIAAPFGTDTYVMVTSETALPDPTVLEGDAVASRGLGQPSPDPLSRLLGAASIGQRGLSVTTPVDWSIQRLTIRSIAK